MNAVEIEQAISDLADADYDAVEFPFAFLECFDNSAARSKVAQGNIEQVRHGRRPAIRLNPHQDVRPR